MSIKSIWKCSEEFFLSLKYFIVHTSMHNNDFQIDILFKL